MLTPQAASAQSTARLLYVTVIDNEQDAPLHGLGADDFYVIEDGARREVLRASRATDPMQLALLIDTSAASRPVLTDFRLALEAFLLELPGTNEVTVATFGGPRNILVGPTNDVQRVRSSFSKLFARPDTATYLLGALIDTARGFERRAAPRPAVVVLTTNGVDFSEDEPQDVVTRLRGTGASMHVVAARTASVEMKFQGTFGTAAFPSWASRARDLILDTGPRQSGGRRIDVSALSGATRALQQIAFELTSQYAVVYASPATLLPGRLTGVGVRVPNITVRATPSRAGQR